MDTTYGRAVALAVPVSVLAVALEFGNDRVRRTHYYHLADAINSLSRGIVFGGVRDRPVILTIAPFALAA